MYPSLRKVAFKFDAELVHNFAVHVFRHLRKPSAIIDKYKKSPKKYRVSSNNLNWKFPVGLAAGFDKNAKCLDFLSSLGFGSIEVGTVTPLPQPGNPKPRIFRYPQDFSLRNAMGFPNLGMDKIYNDIAKYKGSAKIGINLGRNKLTPEVESSSDYYQLYQKFAKIADYLVINISSPNTPGLRNLQNRQALIEILETIEEQRLMSSCRLFLKIAPDLSFPEIEDIYNISLDFNLNGIIATNTTIMPSYGVGGMSGKILYEKSRNIRNFLLNLNSNHPDFDIIGCGGFAIFDHILDFWKNGGRFIQIYTSLIYQSPKILVNFRKQIDRLLDEAGVENLIDLFNEGNFQSLMTVGSYKL